MCKGGCRCDTDAVQPIRTLRVGVIGAGCAGLVCARELVREGHDVQVFEQKANIGGIWDFQEEVEDDLLGIDPSRRRVHSSMYSSLRINLPRQIMSFSDFPFIPAAMGGRSTDARTFCHHSEVHAWLEAFVEAFDLRRLVRFNTRVTDLRPLIDPQPCAANGSHTDEAACGAEHMIGPRWSLTREDANESKATGRVTEVFDAVVVAVGNYHEPNLPDVEGMRSFPALQMHCHNYRHAEAFMGKRVLVVGASFSGQEIALQVADVAQHVYHSARTWGDALSEPAPRRNVERLPMVARLGGDGSAHFVGGRAVEAVDAVIYCTGYKYRYSFLERTGLLSTEDGRVHPLYKHIFVPSVAPTLALVGLLWKSLRNIQFELQARWVAHVLSGRASLPSREAMEADTQAFYDLMARTGTPVRYTHCQSEAMPVNQRKYNAFLGNACAPPAIALEHWREQLHDIAVTKILARPDTFRDEVLPDEAAAFAAAGEACAQMWERHKQRREC